MVSKLMNRVIVILVHVTCWAAVLIYPFLNTPRFVLGARRAEFGQLPRIDSMAPPPGFSIAPPPGFTINSDMLNSFRMPSLVFGIMLMGFFYFNIYFLIPRMLIKRGWKTYVPYVIAGFLCIYAIHQLIPVLFSLDWHRQPLSFSVLTFLTTVALSTSLRLTSDRIVFEQQIKEKENENLKSELSFLRSQVSPHFMFNVLNSLASLARKKSDHLESAIIQLSQLMRYMLYDSGGHKVTVEKEAEYLKSYIDLQKMRFGMDTAVRFNAEIADCKMLIEPMLLIPFVENSFKHGIGMVDDPIIEIQLRSGEHELAFSVKNKFNGIEDRSKDKSSGIGLVNVRRRLDLLYKDLYSLRTSSTNNWYTIELQLILS
jgi:two-component system LytT family sensor kinase